MGACLQRAAPSDGRGATVCAPCRSSPALAGLCLVAGLVPGHPPWPCPRAHLGRPADDPPPNPPACAPRPPWPNPTGQQRRPPPPPRLQKRHLVGRLGGHNGAPQLQTCQLLLLSRRPRSVQLPLRKATTARGLGAVTAAILALTILRPLARCRANDHRHMRLTASGAPLAAACCGCRRLRQGRRVVRQHPCHFFQGCQSVLGRRVRRQRWEYQQGGPKGRDHRHG